MSETTTTKTTVRRLQDLCPECNNVAIEVNSIEITKKGKQYMMTFLKCHHVILREIIEQTNYDGFISNGWRPEIAQCKHQWTGNQCDHCREFKPYNFQIEGMHALERGLSIQRGFGVFDEQGLGKTITSLGVLKYHPEFLPFLWVGKAGVKFQYYKEFIRWLGPEFIAQVISSGRDGVLPGLKAYIISYDTIRNFDISKFAHIKTIILDECQHIKNPDSDRTIHVRELCKIADNIIPLSGTPWKNRGSELFVSLNMINPTKFPSFKHFVNNWVDYYLKGDKYKEGGIRNIPRFIEYSKDCFIRRERAEAMPELPIISRNKFYTELAEQAKKAYHEALTDFVKVWNEHLLEGTEDSFESQGQIIAILQRMRHLVGIAKIPATIEFTTDFISETDRKLCIFVHHKDVGQDIKHILEKMKLGVDVIELTSAMDASKRMEVQEQFNKTPRIIMIASTLASGEGLNLQTCSDCIMHERQWNPANEEQAESRFIRIGQSANKVTATYVIAEDAAIDHKLDEIVETKRMFFHKAMNKGEMPKWNQTDILGDLAKELVKEYNAYTK